MLKVYKYNIEINDYFDLELPFGAKILKVDVQHGYPQLWALIDPEITVMENHKFRFAGTGHPINENSNQLNFIDTFQMDGGNLIFHIFEVIDN